MCFTISTGIRRHLSSIIVVQMGKFLPIFLLAMIAFVPTKRFELKWKQLVVEWSFVMVADGLRTMAASIYRGMGAFFILMRFASTFQSMMKVFP